MKNLSLNTKLEIAIEIMATKIAMSSRQGYTIKDQETIKLLKEREQMYMENEEIIEKIIKEYGPEIKKNYRGE